MDIDDEIIITEAMVNAGYSELIDYELDGDLGDKRMAVARIYMAMALADRDEWEEIKNLVLERVLTNTPS